MLLEKMKLNLFFLEKVKLKRNILQDALFHLFLITLTKVHLKWQWTFICIIIYLSVSSLQNLRIFNKFSFIESQSYLI